MRRIWRQFGDNLATIWWQFHYNFDNDDNMTTKWCQFDDNLTILLKICCVPQSYRSTQSCFLSENGPLPPPPDGAASGAGAGPLSAAGAAGAAAAGAACVSQCVWVALSRPLSRHFKWQQWGDKLEHIVLEYIKFNMPDPDLNTPELSETDYSEQVKSRLQYNIAFWITIQQCFQDCSTSDS